MNYPLMLTCKNKQYKILRAFWNNYVKECDYFPYARTFKHEKYGRVYTFDWDIKKLTIEECDRLLQEFTYRNEKYIEITEALIVELSKVHYPSLKSINVC